MSVSRPNKEEAGYLSLEGVGGEVLTERPEDSELGALRELGKSLVNYFFMALRTLAIHSEDNAAVDLPLQKLCEILKDLSDAVHRTHFITVEGQIYLNDLRIKMETSAYSNVVYLVSTLDKHEIGGITFSRAPDAPALKRLLLLLLNTVPPRGEDADPLANIRRLLQDADIPGVDFDRRYFFKAADAQSLAAAAGDAAAEQEGAAVAYAKGVLAVKDYFRAVEAAETANPLRIRKIIHDLVDVAEEDGEDFLRLHTIHGVEDPYYNHCVNVAVLSVAIGRQLQLSRLELADLGAAAMFHDLGYSALVRMTEEEGREFDDAERRKWHSVSGLKTLLGQGEFGAGLLRRMLVGIEHHMHFKRPGGFPNLGKKRLSVYTRIIQVADHYDALVCPSSDGEPGILPIRALERIIAVSGRVFDPVVVKTLVNVVGRYPYGSLVTLTSDEVGVVTCGGRDEDSFLTPKVMVVRNADGTECAPREVDLAVDRAMKRRVKKVLDPYDESLTPHAVLFDKLGEQHIEASQEVAVDADAWTRAIWSGKSVEELLRDEMEAAEAFAPDVEPTAVPELSPPPEFPEGIDLEFADDLTDDAESEAQGAEEDVDEAESPSAFSQPSSPEAGTDSEIPDGFALLDDFDGEPEPWELADEPDSPEPEAAALSGEPETSSSPLKSSGPTTAAPRPEDMSPAEVAACKAAQQRAVQQAFASGGESAVADIASRHWSEFWPG